MKRAGEHVASNRKRGEREEAGGDMETEDQDGLVFEDPFGDDFEEEEIVEERSSGDEDNGMEDDDEEDDVAEDTAPR